MIREHLFTKELGADRIFRWRGGDVSRVESISDGAFAITIALLIVSISNSDSFYAIWTMVRDLPAIFASFILIIYAWYDHYRFFRRYGLKDAKTIALNSIYLFLIMILAFPLKFLTTFLWYLMIGDTQTLFIVPDTATDTFELMTQRRYMMYFYGFSVLGVFGVMALMHWRALSLKLQLELDDVEILITKKVLIHHIATVCITLLSITILTLTNNPGFSGIVYVLIPLIHTLLHLVGNNKIKKTVRAST